VGGSEGRKVKLNLDEETLAKLRKALEPYNNGPRVDRARCQSKCGRHRHVSIFADGQSTITWSHDAKTGTVYGSSSEMGAGGFYHQRPETPPSGFSFEALWSAADDIETEPTKETDR
jgi:hypothetical protein